MILYSWHASPALVNVGLDIVGLFILLVNDGILGSSGTGAQLGIFVLGDFFVGVLRSTGASTLNSFGDIVGGILFASPY